MTRYATFVILILSLLIGCTRQIRDQEAKYISFDLKKHSSRSKMPKVVKQDIRDYELNKKGYIFIGLIKASLLSKRCSKKYSNCKEISDKSGIVCEKAKKHGGDLVIFNYSEKPHWVKKIYKNGKCAKWGRWTKTYMPVAKYKNGQWVSEHEMVRHRECIDRHRIHKSTEYYISTYAQVWRYDPELSKKDSLKYLYKDGNCKEIKEKLFSSNAIDINAAVGYNGNTLLHYCAKAGCLEMTELLIAKNARVNVKSNDGLTPLHSAVYGKYKVVALLIENKAKVNAVEGNKRTPLHLAAYGGHKDIVELLIRKGAKINMKDLGGYTPLHLAAYGGHKDIVELLIRKGAKVNVKDMKGNTPLDTAAHEGHKDTVELLIRYIKN